MAQGIDGCLGAGTHAQLGVNVVQVKVDRAGTDEQQPGDLFVAQAH